MRQNYHRRLFLSPLLVLLLSVQTVGLLFSPTAGQILVLPERFTVHPVVVGDVGTNVLVVGRVDARPSCDVLEEPGLYVHQ